MSASVPFPGQTQLPQHGASASGIDDDLKIDILREVTRDEAPPPHKRQSSFHAERPYSSTTPSTGWHHHPRQPGPHSESYFSGSTSASANMMPRPSSNFTIKGHSRHINSSANQALTFPMSLNLTATANGEAATPSHSAFGAATHAGPPSPSTLTDVILGLHSTFYSGKRKPEQVKEMVSRYYETGAVFESPLLSAHGKEQIANQFIMAFALPGMDVKSELRDVICSDFEFDGTRAGIIDHTVTVTLFPSLFGTDTTTSSAPADSDVNRTPRAHAGQSSYPQSALPVTPHPFIDYAANSAFSRIAGQSRPHSPTTPFSFASVWGGSRPHTPGYPGATAVRPLSNTSGYPTHTPPSVNGDDVEGPSGINSSSAYIDADTLQQELASRPAIPADALTPHWTSEGLGRKTFRTLLWSLFHPRAVMKSLCSIQLRVMSRLEFNDAGLIVRHEDTWGLRETIEGIIPFASLVYSIERRLVGLLVSWAIAKGFNISAALLRKAIPGGCLDDSSYQQISQQEAESIFSQNTPYPARLGREYYTISRSRAPSPSRFRFGSNPIEPRSGTVTGTRSRARSLIGQPSMASSRAMSTDNLTQHFVQTEHPSRRSTDLPPDSSAKFRERTAKRLDGGRATSANSAPCAPADSGEFSGPTNNLVNMCELYSTHPQTASYEDRTLSRAPDQDQH